MVELLNPDVIASQSESALTDIEQRLLRLIKEGAHGEKPLSEVIDNLARLITDLRSLYQPVHDILGRRDLSYETSLRFEALRRHLAWLYQKCKLEQIFFRKLQVERFLRDSLYRQVTESWQEMSALEDEEQGLRNRDEDSLLTALLEEPWPGEEVPQ